MNGSGKSTTLKMLSGEILPSQGTATLDGLDMLFEQGKVRRMIGYCPQFDALLDLLTVREHLELFGRLKGVPESHLNSKVAKKMAELRLTEYEHRLAHTLSGGNRRKLSVAICLMGDPLLLLMDEPTTGVDALNRRFLCDVIAEYSVHKQKGAVVLTTHSMEEVEALATRVGILSAGQFKCLGSIQHLKNRFGKGIVFRIRMLPPDEDGVTAARTKLEAAGMGEVLESSAALEKACRVLGCERRKDKFTSSDPTGWMIQSALEKDGGVDFTALSQWWASEDDGDKLEGFIRQKFGNAEIMERRPGQYVFRALELELSLGECFSVFEEAKEDYHVQEYSVAETSLESIFIALAQQNMD